MSKRTPTSSILPSNGRFQWYRGGSLQALVYDRTPGVDDPIKTYDLFTSYGMAMSSSSHVPGSTKLSRTSMPTTSLTSRHTSRATALRRNDRNERRWLRTERPSRGHFRDLQLVTRRRRRRRDTKAARTRRNRYRRRPRRRRSDHVNRTPPRRDARGPRCALLRGQKHPRRVRNQYDLGKFLFLYPSQLVTNSGVPRSGSTHSTSTVRSRVAECCRLGKFGDRSLR